MTESVAQSLKACRMNWESSDPFRFLLTVHSAARAGRDVARPRATRGKMSIVVALEGEGQSGGKALLQMADI